MWYSEPYCPYEVVALWNTFTKNHIWTSLWFLTSWSQIDRYQLSWCPTWVYRLFDNCLSSKLCMYMLWWFNSWVRASTHLYFLLITLIEISRKLLTWNGCEKTPGFFFASLNKYFKVKAISVHGFPFAPPDTWGCWYSPLHPLHVASP